MRRGLWPAISQDFKEIQMSQKLALRLAAIPAFVLATSGAAHAALPTEVSTAITSYQTDATTAIGLIMGAGVIIWGLLKLASKMGWR